MSAAVAPVAVARDTPKVWKRVPKRLQTAVSAHAAERAEEIHQKYGPAIDYPTLLRILEDRRAIRYPVRVEFGTENIEPGLFAATTPISKDPADGYVITIHEHFHDRPEAIPALVLYQSVIVNYGDLAGPADGEIFGAGVLGMDRDAYYQLICELVDSMPDAE